MEVKVLELEGTREECAELLEQLGHAHKHIGGIPEPKSESRPFGGRFARMSKHPRNAMTKVPRKKSMGWSEEAKLAHKERMRAAWARRKENTKASVEENIERIEEKKEEKKGILGGLGL